MSIGRKLLLSAAALALPSALVTVVTAGPASAGNPPFSGPASGKVTCTGVSVQLKLSPSLTLTTGGNNVSIKGKLSNCTVTGSTDAISSGKFKGSTTGMGTGCAGLASGSTTPINLDIKWKGTHGGSKAKFSDSMVSANGFTAVSEPDGSGDAGFQLPNTTGAAGGNVTGSFAAATINDFSQAYINMTQNQIVAACGAKKGIKKLVIDAGSVVIP